MNCPRCGFTKLGLLVFFFVVSSLFTVLSAVKAEESKEARDLKQKVHQRLFPGGKDEQDLKVQTQVPLVQRKMTPTNAPEPIIETPSDE